MLPVANPDAKHCTTTVRFDGIYHIRFLKASRKSVLEGCFLYKRLRWQHPKDQPFKLLVDLRPAGFPPIAYAFNHCQRLFRRHPLPPNAQVVYLLAEHSPITSVVKGLYDVLQLDTTSIFFYGDDGEAQAIASLSKPTVAHN